MIDGLIGVVGVWWRGMPTEGANDVTIIIIVSSKEEDVEEDGE